MLSPTWTLILGVPIIVGLLLLTARRIRKLRERLQEHYAQEQKETRSPWERLGEIMNEPKPPRNRR